MNSLKLFKTVLIAGLWLTSVVVIHAQDSTQAAPNNRITKKPEQTILVHPFSSVSILGFSLSYEKLIKPRLSLEIPAYFGFNSSYGEQGRLFIGSGVGLRLYLDRPNDGGYISPMMEIVSMQYFKDGQKTEGNTVITLTWLRYGYKFLWEHFTLDLGGGFGWGQTLGGSLVSPTESPVMGLIPVGHVALGVPF